VEPVDFRGYQRRLDVFDYRSKRRDLPHDVVELLALSQAIELEDRIIVDVEDNRE
jgi:hypothetical protein